MTRQCWICKNSEDDFMSQKEKLLTSLKNEIKKYENYIQNIKNITIEKLDFTEARKNEVQTIPEAFANMSFKTIAGDPENFFKLIAPLKIIYDYAKKYYFHDAMNKLTIKDLIQRFQKEPIEDRYKNDLIQYERKLKDLNNKKEQIESIKSFFIEKDITPETIDRNLEKCKSIPIFDDSSFPRNTIDNRFKFSFQRLGFDFSKKIFICPICLSLFAEASGASFEIKEAQEKAYSSMFDDCDDYGEEDY